VLSNTKVKGNVLVKEDGRLQANGAIVDGNVRANKAKSALLQFSSQVKGNLSIKNTTDPAATSGFDINVRVGGNAEFEANKSRVFVDAAMVGGNLTVTKNVNPSVLEVEFNTVGGGVKVEKNAVPTGTSMTVLGNAVGDKMVVSGNSGSGNKQVVTNKVAGNLRCVNNSAPFVGGPNNASTAQGQCF